MNFDFGTGHDHTLQDLVDAPTGLRFVVSGNGAKVTGYLQEVAFLPRSRHARARADAPSRERRLGPGPPRTGRREPRGVARGRLPRADGPFERKKRSPSRTPKQADANTDVAWTSTENGFTTHVVTETTLTTEFRGLDLWGNQTLRGTGPTNLTSPVTR